MILASIIADQGAPGRDAPTPLRWMADWLPDAQVSTLAQDDLARIEAYRGNAIDLHQMLATVLPLPRPIWFEVAATAAGGRK